MRVELVAQKDRRALTRLRTPKCPQCGSREGVVVALRTTRFIHFRCLSCGELKTERNPVAAVEGAR